MSKQKRMDELYDSLEPVLAAVANDPELLVQDEIDVLIRMRARIENSMDALREIQAIEDQNP